MTNANEDPDAPRDVAGQSEDRVESDNKITDHQIAGDKIDDDQTDDDKWRLESRMRAHLQNSPPAETNWPPDPDIAQKLERLFRPKATLSPPRNWIERTFDSVQSRKSPTAIVQDQTQRDEPEQNKQPTGPRAEAGKRRSNEFAPRIVTKFALYIRSNIYDLVFAPLAAFFFTLPLATISAIDVQLRATEIIGILFAAAFSTALIVGPRFGTIAVIAAYIYVVIIYDNPSEAQSLPFYSLQIVKHLLIGVTAAICAYAIGLAGARLKMQFKLGRLGLAREADLEQFQKRILRARQIESIFAFLIAYCRTTLRKNCVFLALDESQVELDTASSLEIVSQLRTVHYARVVVDRKSYVPRAIKSFKSAGLAAYPLETPSGTIGILGIDIARSGKISPLDDRYLRLLLFSVAYAIERIHLKDRLHRIEERDSDEEARRGALTSLLGNVSVATDNLTHNIAEIRSELNHDPNHPLDTKVNALERQFGALRNSLALLREVINRKI